MRIVTPEQIAPPGHYAIVRRREGTLVPMGIYTDPDAAGEVCEMMNDGAIAAALDDAVWPETYYDVVKIVEGD